MSKHEYHQNCLYSLTLDMAMHRGMALLHTSPDREGEEEVKGYDFMPVQPSHYSSTYALPL